MATDPTSQILEGASPEIKAAFDALLESVGEALTVAKSAEEENVRLKSALAAKDQVILEKVASEKKTVSLDEEKLAALVASLVSKRLVTKEAAVQFTEGIMKEPNLLIKLAENLATISNVPKPQGSGIAKEAHHVAKQSDPEADAWAKVASEGA